MAVEEHFDRLLSTLPPQQLTLYRSMKNLRMEDAFRGRTFYLYEIVDREPNVLDVITVEDFLCNDSVGASTEVRNRDGDVVEVSYTPVQLFNYPVFLFLPLHTKTRWSSTPRRFQSGGSLAFPIGIRVLSRLHPRERGVVHCETGVAFAKEFETSKI